MSCEYIYSYEDLKPPTSPIPTSTTSLGATKPKEVVATEAPVETNVVPPPDDIPNVAVEEKEEEEVKQAEEKKEGPLSPYAR